MVTCYVKTPLDGERIKVSHALAEFIGKTRRTFSSFSEFSEFARSSGYSNQYKRTIRPRTRGLRRWATIFASKVRKE